MTPQPQPVMQQMPQAGAPPQQGTPQQPVMQQQPMSPLPVTAGDQQTVANASSPAAAAAGTDKKGGFGLWTIILIVFLVAVIALLFTAWRWSKSSSGSSSRMADLPRGEDDAKRKGGQRTTYRKSAVMNPGRGQQANTDSDDDEARPRAAGSGSAQEAPGGTGGGTGGRERSYRDRGPARRSMQPSAQQAQANRS